ncbi:fimbria/pilus periplasmic chaperone [Erwinia sp. B116]|uniref:fimbria/pilus periplasmic chaperone n=1 Tax=Erwinia sp. B116 TaxID=1561024 RepID=UPI000C7652DC|nr:fimbria/pilus periplasmic chaperone [Erwinia sp. B116]PLV62356.1 molecular chaperone [Erwinia sp. B116]
MFTKKIVALAIFTSALAAQQATAAIALDRTRVVFDGNAKSVSLSISNQNPKLPYLAQAWIEDAQGKKIASPLTVLPPLQRVEPGSKSQVRLQALPAASTLPQDRETLYYFNLREIPPKSEKANTLQIALQTRIKLFYRPATLRQQQNAPRPQEQLTLTRQGDRYVVNNPTGYYITLIDGAASSHGKGLDNFRPLMVAPKSSGELNVSASQLGSSPVLTFVDDYGGRPALSFTCTGNSCHVQTGKSGS